MNEEDSEQIEDQLRSIGLRPAQSWKEAGVVLLNTCSVRKKPEDKAFSMLGRLAELKKERPELILGVCGCMAQLRADEIRTRAPFVDFVVGTGQIAHIAELVLGAAEARSFQTRLELPERKGSVVTDVPSRSWRLATETVSGPQEQPKSRESRLKAFVPIQYGCDKFCTFCIVPTTRGRERSRPTEDVLQEVSALAASGVKEVTLLGQTVNSYGKNLMEGRVPFSRLLWRLAEVPGLERIRYTSPYPRDFKEDLISAHRDCAKVMEHCHLPLQSGDDEVLREMRRVYTVATYSDIYRRLRSVPGMSITTDIIVGFPGETEEQFGNTMRKVEELRFDSAFMFAYSPRPGTPSAERPDQVPPSVRHQRLKELIALQSEITSAINAREVGSCFEVLVEGPSEKDPAMLKGLTRHAKMVHFPASSDANAIRGQLRQVVAESAHLWGFKGRLAD
jgi:tRNA-2-methylthio-N6-dimethylallyladenosine synthase